MHSGTLIEGIRERVAMLVDADPSEILEETPFVDFGVDSLMLLELVAMVERHVGFEVPEQDFGSLRTLGDVHRYVAALPSMREGADRPV